MICDKVYVSLNFGKGQGTMDNCDLDERKIWQKIFIYLYVL